jgi:tetratricopeptide (TPR) repeat protein
LIGSSIARVLCAAVLLPWLLGTASAHAAPAFDQGVLQAAASEVQQDKLDSAIARLESAADSGSIHPDAAFTRGVAYLRRALSERAKPGDYGQAVAGFREALLLRPQDGEAELALEQTRLAVARRSANLGEQVLDTLGLGERVLLSLNPWILFWLSVLSSALTTIGLVLYRVGRGPTKRVGSLMAGISGLLLAALAPLTWLAESTANSLDLGVVITEHAPLLDASGRARKGLSPLREGTEVRVVENRGPLLRLSLGEGSTFVRAQQVRRLRVPR